MIKTQKLRSVATKIIPKNGDTDVYINVLTWHPANHTNGSKYHVFSPYYLKTDGLEEQANDGQVLFENFWQGSKVWPKYYDQEIWAHPNLRGKSQHLWFSYTCRNGLGSELHLDHTDELQPEYYRWKEAMFACKHAVRYPNRYARTSQVAFSLLVDKDGKETRLNYIEARKRIYVKEYCRLVRKLPEYKELQELYAAKKH